MAESSNNIQNLEKDSHNDNNSMELDESKNYFQRLFSFDWFLIEIGRKLISSGDQDLISILLLNKAINKRATLVFSQHFFNFQLQKEILKLVEAKDFNQIQQLFERNSLALNPNIIFNFKFEKQCVHDEKVKQYLAELKLCTCGTIPTKHLSVFSSRTIGLESLTRLLLSHPRISFENLFEIKELFHWSVLNGHLDLVDSILKHAKLLYWATSKYDSSDEKKILHKFDPNSESKMSAFKYINFDFSFVAAIVFDRFEVLTFLKDSLNSATDWIWVPYSTPFLEICSKSTLGLKYFDQILDFRTKRFVKEDIHAKVLWENLMQSCNYSADYVQLVVKYILLRHKKRLQRFSVIVFEPRRVMEKLLENDTKRDKESSQIVMSFAFSFGFEKVLLKLIEERETSERDLLDLFHVRFYSFPEPNDVKVLKLILNRLDPQKPFLESDFSTLLDLVIERNNLELFKLVWNDKRIVLSQQWINDFVTKHLLCNNVEVIKFLLPLCDFSAPMEFRKAVRVEFSHYCILNFFETKNWNELEYFKTDKRVNWTAEFLLMILSIGGVGPASQFLLKNQLISDSCWSKKAIHWVLDFAADNGIISLFDLCLSRFPNADLGTNNNEILRSMLSRKEKESESLLVVNQTVLLEKFSKSSFRFKNQEEKNQILKLLNSDEVKHLELISNIKLMNEK